MINLVGTLRPSGSPRWGPGACPGSFAMEAPFPEEQDTPEAIEGTAAHHWATEAVQRRPLPIGAIAPNGHPIDAEMIEAGDHLVRDVSTEWAALADPQALFRVETKVFMHGTIHPDNEGTPDVFIASALRKKIIVWDFKYGHRFVEVFRNWQTVDYLAGVVEGLQLTPAEFADWDVSLRICQPRYYGGEPTREWNLKGQDALVLFEELRQAALAAKRPNAPLITGPHCRDCLAVSVCPAIRQVGSFAIDLSGQSIPHELDSTALGLWLKAIDTAQQRLKALRDGFEATAAARIKRGENVAHWYMGPGETREKWIVPADQVFALGDMMGVDLRKPDATLTPAQARKAGIDPVVIKAYAEKPAGAMKLQLADGKTAAKAFSKT